MRQAIIKKGLVIGEEIPAPVVSDGSLLIKVVNSCISAGTEMGGVRSSSEPIIKRALEQPEKIKKVFNMVRDVGIFKAYQTISGKLDSGVPTGYSTAGVVIGVGAGVTEYAVGDHVAAAGAGIANHAEYIDVPVNLTVRLPKTLSFKSASTVTLGAIAMQGVRRAEMKMGEFCVVFGTGILGLLAVQMLKLSGIRIIAVDLDKKRLELAGEYGAELVVSAAEENAVERVIQFTGGYGADAVLFTAATSSSEPLSQSFKMCRKKGRVVLVGVAGMEIKREDIYLKELDFLISTSYGPGRYDNNYEHKGVDYPYAYVRWTENRNMSEYIRLLDNRSINVDKLIDAEYPIEKVTEAFESLKGANGNKPILVCLDYGLPNDDILGILRGHNRKVEVNSRPVSGELIKVALIGAGGFANAMHLPNMQKMSDKYQLHAVIDIDGHRAKSYARQYNAEYASTEINDVLSDENVNLLMVCTRHDSHAGIVLRGLNSGKAVFVEKPLAVNENELNQIKQFYNDAGDTAPLLMVGFNRRFSKYAREIKKNTDQRINPLLMHYRMNAGYIPLDHWVHEYGGRIVGEGCHLIDLMTYLTGCEIISLNYQAVTPKNNNYHQSDNKTISLKYSDGSIGTIDYFATGNADLSKEFMEVHFDGKSIVMDDYKSLTGYGVKVAGLTSSDSEKGQYEELEELYKSLTGKNKNWPIALWDMLQTTNATLLIK
ncbi:MAG: bi-domain-containing oxidoreductase [Candidatus Zixiibacteriota bacterium]